MYILSSAITITIISRLFPVYAQTAGSLYIDKRCADTEYQKPTCRRPANRRPKPKTIQLSGSREKGYRTTPSVKTTPDDGT
ncbi:hypothetical protein P153DRAFT_79009 [Dothidotthia symphoricarpi CBS 119687]|uniref:Secreted protein n=1 Tax=Dothidotthia symphoricarpi CBS 119687 TaxID=1392245 RepID=A0A6A6A5S6_9PLEO|nr:uncharacterized protein P153DRAFT_79009 [Dothidotthia symphoricarpi CBS 119687]KAF2126513.1 hypothetical protein P153DRAFT_79009 [Dothidotthia symphoricarpi CBS 119687]